MTQKQRPGQKIKMISVDELLGVNNEESAIDIKVDQIVPFQNHPFKVLDDEKMDDLINSIRQNGILTPVLVRPVGDNQYEMVSGHRRLRAAKAAGVEAVPAFIRELSDDDATIIMVDANIQREELLPSEKAYAYKMKLDAIKHQGKNTRTSSQNGRKLEAAEVIADQVGESRNQVHRFVRLTELIPDLLELVDAKRLLIMTGVDISYIDKETQKLLYEYIKENGMVKSYQVTALRKYIADEHVVNYQVLARILNDNLPGKVSLRKVSFSEKKLRTFFSANYSVGDMEKIILKLLTQWKEEQDGGKDGI